MTVYQYSQFVVLAFFLVFVFFSTFTPSLSEENTFVPSSCSYVERMNAKQEVYVEIKTPPPLKDRCSRWKFYGNYPLRCDGIHTTSHPNPYYQSLCAF